MDNSQKYVYLKRAVKLCALMVGGGSRRSRLPLSEEGSRLFGAVYSTSSHSPVILTNRFRLVVGLRPPSSCRATFGWRGTTRITQRIRESLGPYRKGSWKESCAFACGRRAVLGCLNRRRWLLSVLIYYGVLLMRIFH